MSRDREYCDKCSHSHWEDGACTYSANQYEGLHQQLTEQKAGRKRAEDDRDQYRALLTTSHNAAGVNHHDRQLALDLLDLLGGLNLAGDTRTSPNPDARRSPNRESRMLAPNRWAREQRKVRNRVRDIIQEVEQKIAGTWNPPEVWRARCKNRTCDWHGRDQKSMLGPIEFCGQCGRPTTSMTAAKAS